MVIPDILRLYIEIEIKCKAMDKTESAAILVLVLALVFTTRFSIANNNRERNNVNEEEQSKIIPMWLFHRLRSSYSLYSSVFCPTKYWHLFKALLNQSYTYFFPPNIDFRSGNEVEYNNGVAGEKVKEASGKSVGTSKATLEDAAKSAADIVGETIHKVKRTFSDDDDDEEIKIAKKEL